MAGPIPSPYHAGPWRTLVALIIAIVVLGVGYHLTLLFAYHLQAGATAKAAVNAYGSSYMADDLHSVPKRAVATILVAATVWSLIHHYGRRGPILALAYALACSVVGYQTFVRNSGPIDHAAQYLAYAIPAVFALMLAWAISYRRKAQSSRKLSNPP